VSETRPPPANVAIPRVHERGREMSASTTRARRLRRPPGRGSTGLEHEFVEEQRDARIPPINRAAGVGQPSPADWQGERPAAVTHKPSMSTGYAAGGLPERRPGMRTKFAPHQRGSDAAADRRGLPA